MDNLKKAEKLAAKIFDSMEELVSYVEEAITVAATMNLDELAEWKLLLKALQDHYKMHKSKLGGFNVKLDFPLVDQLVQEGHEHYDVGNVRLYPDMRGFFDIDKGMMDEFEQDEAELRKAGIKLFTTSLDVKELTAYCEGLLRDGQPLPDWVKKHLQPTVKVRKIKG